MQQTQVVSVINYFQRFMLRFPTIDSLSQADMDEVLQHWSGLGYYARARNLHKTAQQIVAQGGQFPETVEALSDLPGIGRSTAGAILSIACGQSQPILDGNVKRVLARFHAVRGWPGENKVAARLWQISAQYTPAKRTGDYTQAIMDLGATLCTRSKPQCEICPVASACLAKQLGLIAQLPESKPRKNLPVKQSYFLLLVDAEGRIFLERRPPTGIWGGLWSLPEFPDPEALQNWCLQADFRMGEPQFLAGQRHSFSHYHLDFIPVRVKLQNHINNVMEGGKAVWYKTAEINNLGLPAPIKRLLQQHSIEEHHGKNN